MLKTLPRQMYVYITISKFKFPEESLARSRTHFGIFNAKNRRIKEYISDEHKMVIDIWQLMTIFPQSRSYNLRTVACSIGEYKSTRPVCPGNRGMVAVSANGNVYPCMQMSGTYDARGDFLGNVKESGLQPLLQMGKYLAEVCTTVGELAEVNEECRNCPYFKYCAGGCRAVAYAWTGSIMGVDLSKCLFFKRGYYKMVVHMMGDWRNNTPIISE